MRALREYTASVVTYSAVLFKDTTSVAHEELAELRQSFSSTMGVAPVCKDTVIDMLSSVELRVVRKAGFTDTEPSRSIQVKVLSTLVIKQGKHRHQARALSLSGRWASLGTVVKSISCINNPLLRVTVARAVYHAVRKVTYADMMRLRHQTPGFRREDLTYCFRQLRSDSSYMDKLREFAQLQP
jgi:hypothetical protein